MPKASVSTPFTPIGALASITIRFSEEPFFFSPDSSFLSMVHRITPWVSCRCGAQRSSGQLHPFVTFRLLNPEGCNDKGDSYTDENAAPPCFMPSGVVVGCVADNNVDSRILRYRFQTSLFAHFS